MRMKVFILKLVGISVLSMVSACSKVSGPDMYMLNDAVAYREAKHIRLFVKLIDPKKLNPIELEQYADIAFKEKLYSEALIAYQTLARKRNDDPVIAERLAQAVSLSGGGGNP